MPGLCSQLWYRQVLEEQGACAVDRYDVHLGKFYRCLWADIYVEGNQANSIAKSWKNWMLWCS